MDLKQLGYFLSVARHLSITGAAGEIGVAQPTLTKSIRALEQELGVTLFTRLPRGVELTIFGESLVRHVETVHVQVEDALKEIEGLRGGAIGIVKIGAGPAWLRRHLPAAISRSLADNPGIQVRVEGGFDDALLRSLRKGDLDFVVAELPSDHRASDLSVLALTSDTLGVCCRAGHPLATGAPVAMHRLLDFPWIMPPRGTRAQRRLRALFVTSDLVAPEPVVETESMAFLLQMLRVSDALTFTVSTTLLSPEAQGLEMLDVAGLSAMRQAGIITRKNSWMSPAAVTIVDQLKKICSETPQN
jgi:LysR family transcriptional regulator of gallate degradation